MLNVKTVRSLEIYKKYSVVTSYNHLHLMFDQQFKTNVTQKTQWNLEPSYYSTAKGGLCVYFFGVP